MSASRHEQRQRTRKFTTARYEPYPKCCGCKTPVPPDEYASHPMTDCVGDDGQPWHDTALVLCDRCYTRTDHMRNVGEFVRYRDTGWY